MEERNKILTSLRMSNSKRHHYHDNVGYHNNMQPQLSLQSDGDNDQTSSRDPLLEPTGATPNLFTTTNVVHLPSSSNSQSASM